MEGLQFYILFKSISAISGQWVDDNKRLCAIEPRLQLKRILAPAGLNAGQLDQQASAEPAELLGLPITNCIYIYFIYECNVDRDQ